MTQSCRNPSEEAYKNRLFEQCLQLCAIGSLERLFKKNLLFVQVQVPRLRTIMANLDSLWNLQMVHHHRLFQ